MKKLYILIFSLVFTDAHSEPFKLKPPAVQAYKPSEASVRNLRLAVDKCFPRPSALNFEVSANAELSSNSNASIIFKMPLYSSKETYRLQELSSQRQRRTAKAIADILTTVNKITLNRRMIDMYSDLIIRSERRVSSGFADLSELTGFIEKRENLALNLQNLIAQQIEAEEILLSYCSDTKKFVVESALKNFHVDLRKKRKK